MRLNNLPVQVRLVSQQKLYCYQYIYIFKDRVGMLLSFAITNIHIYLRIE